MVIEPICYSGREFLRNISKRKVWDRHICSTTRIHELQKIGYTKVCSCCDTEKDLREYRRTFETPFAVVDKCRECESGVKIKQVYKNTKRKLTCTMYHNQCNHSKERGHKPPEYTLQELRDWVYSHKDFERLYKSYVKSGYIKDLIPSVDRLDDSVGYSFNNIQLITWAKNNSKGHTSKLGVGKRVVQYTLEGKLITTYSSIGEASRAINNHVSSISKACSNAKLSAGGFRWSFLLSSNIECV